MHPSNTYYGHRQILSEYAEVDVSRPLPRLLQHGTTLANPLVEQRRMVPWLRGLVWGSPDLERALEFGFEGTDAIGAPFLYLRELSGTPPMPSTGSTILYPYHATEKSAMEGSHQGLISTVLEREDNPVTACLYWVEYENVELRRAYEEAGFRVVCHGQRTDPGFLRRQYDELSRHTRVITNRVCTAAFYGGALGRDIEVYGEVFASSGQHELARRMQAEAYPELVDGGLNSAQALGLANRILGFEHLRTPADLRDACDWSTPGSSRAKTMLTRAEHYRRAAAVRVSDRVLSNSR